MARADNFVLLDTVQLEKQSWQCRNRLKSVQGEPFWLTVPLAAHDLNTVDVGREASGGTPPRLSCGAPEGRSDFAIGSILHKTFHEYPAHERSCG